MTPKKTKIVEQEMFEEPMASLLTNSRIEARRKRRLTYDCMNAIVVGQNVVCRKKHKLSFTKGLGLLSVLRGRTSLICQTCKDYDEEITE